MKSEVEAELIDVLRIMNELRSSEVKDHIGRVRKIIEEIYAMLNEHYPSYMPNEFFDRKNIFANDGKVNLTYAQRYLRGEHVTLHSNGNDLNPPGKALPEHLCYILPMIKDVTSCAGSHRYQPKVTSNTMKTVVYGLLELLVWLNDFVEEKTKK